MKRRKLNHDGGDTHQPALVRRAYTVKQEQEEMVVPTRVNLDLRPVKASPPQVVVKMESNDSGPSRAATKQDAPQPVLGGINIKKEEEDYREPVSTVWEVPPPLGTLPVVTTEQDQYKCTGCTHGWIRRWAKGVAVATWGLGSEDA
jgi:hypothetical protein